ncbi:MAG: mevalonate kinase family protein [Flavobacteriaceae bacterium]
MKGPLFYAKILLFGEYGIIKDSKGLAIPFNTFNGALRFDDVEQSSHTESNQKLKGYTEYLKQKRAENTLKVPFDFERLEADLADGMYFDSSIPMGYGVGSSGAIVAALYDRYATEKVTVLENLTREKLLDLKQQFGVMESFFHGTSSGLDPLNSYLSIPILIHAKDHVESTHIPSQKLDGKGAVFLLDSGVVGETAPMVQLFMKNLENKQFEEVMRDQFVKYTDACIDHFLKGEVKGLFKDLRKLSQVVFEHFKPMIPESVLGLWQKGLETDAYYLKLCGSGGGGYFLGFTEDLERAKRELEGHTLEVVYTF